MAIAIHSAGALVSEGEGEDLQAGRYFVRIYEGTRNYIYGIVAETRGIRLSYDLQSQGAKYRLTLRLPRLEGGTEIPFIEHRMDTNRVMKSLYSPEVARIAGISEDDRRKIEDAVRNPTPGQSPSLTNPDAIELYLMHLDGVDGKEVDQSVLISSLTHSAGYALADHYRLGSGLIYTTAQVKAEVNPTTNIRKVMDANDLEMEELPEDYVDRFRYGWLKRRPQVVSVWGGKQSFVLQFEFGLWPYLMYLDKP